MKTSLAVLLFLFVGLICQAQQGFKLGASVTSYSTPYYKNSISQFGSSFDMSYSITNNLFIGTHVNFGKFNYCMKAIEELDENVEQIGTNTTANALHLGLLLGFNTRFGSIFNLSIATGASSYTELDKLPCVEVPSGLELENKTTNQLAIPVRAGMDIYLWSGFSIGLITGLYYIPDYPIVGVHFGTSLNYTFSTGQNNAYHSKVR